MKKSILIVDDELSVRLMVDKIIRDAGFQAIHASDGQRGLHALHDNPGIALIVTDIQMPEMDGWEFIKRVRRDSRWKKVPIFCTSGIIKVSEIGALLDAGANRFLAKPFTRKEFKEDLMACLSESQ